MAAEKLREIALREGLPDGFTLPPEAGKKVGLATARIQQYFDDAYDDTIKSYAFNVPSNLKDDLTSLIKAKGGQKTTVNQQTIDKVNADVRALIDRFSNGGKVLDGSNLLNVKREISDLITQAKGHEKFAYQAADEYLDDIVRTELKQGVTSRKLAGKAYPDENDQWWVAVHEKGKDPYKPLTELGPFSYQQATHMEKSGNFGKLSDEILYGKSSRNLADLKRYEELTPAYRAFKPVKDAAEAEADKEGRFLFRTLARKAKRSPEQRALGQIGAATLDRSPVTSGIAGKVLAGAGALGTAGFGAYMGLVPAATAIAGGNALASKPAQRLLLGDTKFQKMLSEALRKNPELTKQLGSLGRAAVVSQTRGEGDE